MYSKFITSLYYQQFSRQSTVCHSQQVAQRPFGLARLGLNWLSWESGRHGSTAERAKTNQSAGARIFGSDHLEPVTNFLLKMQQRRATSWSFELKLGFWFGLGSVRLGKVQVFQEGKKNILTKSTSWFWNLLAKRQNKWEVSGILLNFVAFLENLNCIVLDSRELRPS